MGVICNHCIELHNTKAFFLCLCKAVKNQFLANVFTTEISSYCIAGITDMSASSYIVRVQDIETDNFIVVSVYCDSCIGLLFEKSISCFFCQVFFLWECYTILYHLIPYCNSCCYVFCLIFSDYNTHSSVLHFPYHTVNDQFSVSLHTSAHCLVLFALETWDLLDSIKIPESSPCFRIIFAADSSACYWMKFDFCSIQYSN